MFKNLKLNESTVSTILGGVVIFITVGLIFNYWRSSRATLPSPTPTPIVTPEVKLVEKEGKLVPQNLPQTHKVEKGETLWSIAAKYYTSGYNWVDIAKANNLRTPNKLLVGQELTIPETGVRVPKVSSSVESPVIGQTQISSISGDSYTVVKGDNLWSIAVRAYGDGYQWVKISKVNKLVRPGIIHPGNVLSIPR